MKGLAPQTAAIFEAVSRLECLRPYFLVGGTALSLQLGTRLSEDLDFMSWRKSRNEKREVDWPAIQKMEVLLRRSRFRDYYDFYSLLQHGIELGPMIDLALKYSGHRLKRKNLIAMLTNGTRFALSGDFANLQPIYEVTPQDIEMTLRSRLLPTD